MIDPKLKRIMSDDLLSFADLKSDSLYSQIEAKQVLAILEEAMDLGLKTAQNVRERYPNKSILSLCEEHGIQVIYSDSKQRFTSLKIRAEYFHYEKKLTIYEQSVETMLSEVNKITTLSRDEIVDIHLAHEFFHYLEYEKIGLVNERLAEIELKGFFGRTRKATVVQSREIAAHMFCKELMNLEMHPRYIDYMYLLANGDVSEKKMYTYFQKLQIELNKIKKGMLE